jgi:hypothetical protein
MTQSECASLLLISGVLNDLAELSKERIADHIREVQEKIEKIAGKYLKEKK